MVKHETVNFGNGGSNPPAAVFVKDIPIDGLLRVGDKIYRRAVRFYRLAKYTSTGDVILRVATDDTLTEDILNREVVRRDGIYHLREPD